MELDYRDNANNHNNNNNNNNNNHNDANDNDVVMDHDGGSSSFEESIVPCGRTNRLTLHSLIDYVPIDKPPQFNQSAVTANRFNSVFVVNDADESDVREACQILAYYLRVRFDVSFDRAPQTDDERAGYDLFYSLRDFTAYYKVLRSFIARIYERKQYIADNFERFMAEHVDQRSSSDQQQQQQTGDVGDSYTDAGFSPNGSSGITPDSIELLKQFRELRKMYGQIFESFFSEKYDPAILYERLFIERSICSVVSLVIPIEAVTSLARMLDQLAFLAIQSVDYANSVLPVIISAGFVIYFILYMDLGTDLLGGDEDAREPQSWGKINTVAEGMPSWLHAQIETEAYRREISMLPADLFDATNGDVYVNKHDFIATLLLQTLNRLFMRMIEWPVREDVQVWMNDFLKCENINRFFHESGRNQQLWICFRKRRQVNTDLPSVYVNLNRLNVMYDKIALASKKSSVAAHSDAKDNNGQGSSAVGAIGNGVLGGVADHHADGMAATSVKLTSEDAAVRERLEQLNTFKQRYATFWANGIRQPSQTKFQQVYANMCRQFVVASGGYNGALIANHAAIHPGELIAENVLVHRDLNGVSFGNCRPCTETLTSSTISDMFAIDRWCRVVGNLLFPYNFYALSTSFSGYDAATLRSAVVHKMLESFAVKRMTTDRINKILDFFEENRAICSFIVTQRDMIALWSRTTQLAFFKDFLGL